MGYPITQKIYSAKPLAEQIRILLKLLMLIAGGLRGAKSVGK
jgi:hypothetical protein